MNRFQEDTSHCCRDTVDEQKFTISHIGVVGWCADAGQTSSAEASYNLDYSRAGPYCACSGCGWGLFGHFYSRLSVLSSFSLSLGDGPI